MEKGFCIIIFHKGAVFEGYPSHNNRFGRFAFLRDANLKFKKIKGSKINEIRGVKGMVYEGYFSNYLLNGRGRILLPSGAIIEGDFDDNLLSGEGSYLLSNNNNNRDLKDLIFFESYNERSGIYIYYIYILIKYLDIYITEDGRKVYGMGEYSSTLNQKGTITLQNGEELFGDFKYGKLTGWGKNE